jgi:hypothetical protein
MRNVLWTFLLTMMVVGCADPRGNDGKVSPAPIQTGQEDQPFKPTVAPSVNGQPIKQNTLQLDQPEVSNHNGQFQFQARLKIQNGTEKSVLLQGKIEEDGSAWLFDENDPNLTARLFCLDPAQTAGTCDEFYINAFYQSSDEVLTGQVAYLREIPGATKITTTTVSATTVSREETTSEYESEPIRIPEPIRPQSSAQFPVLSSTDRQVLAERAQRRVSPTTSTSTTVTTTTVKAAPSTTVTTTTVALSGRPKDQAVKKPFDGWMRNATDFLMLSRSATASFNILWPEKKHFFGTWDMKVLIQELGEFIGHRIPGYKLTLGAISAKTGGELRGHSSHQNGLDADIAYIVDNRNLDFRPVVEKGRVNTAFRAQDQWDLMKRAFSTGAVEMMFVDPAIKSVLCKTAKAANDLKDSKDRGLGYQILRRLKPYPMHHHHFHIRIRCSEDQPRCLQDSYYFADSGCF